MGLFTTVEATLQCRKCTREFLDEVQFKTGLEVGLPSYREGAHTTDIPAGRYEGTATAYCSECTKTWTNDEKRSNFAALAEAVSKGAVVVRRGTILRDDRHVPIPDENDDFRVRYFDDREVTAAQLEQEGARPYDKPGWASFGVHLSDRHYIVLDAGRRVYPSRVSIHEGFWSRHRAGVARRMLALGWPLLRSRRLREAALTSSSRPMASSESTVSPIAQP